MVIQGDTYAYGHLLLLWMQYMLVEVYVHVPRLTPPTLELYLHFWGMTTFVTLAVVIPDNLLSILMTLSGMVGGVVPPAPAAVSTPHPGSVKKLSQPTTDDIEVRVCTDQSANDEDVTIKGIQLYLQ